MSSSDDDNWSDVAEENGLMTVSCMFCTHCEESAENLFYHISETHHLDLKLVIVKLNLDFYGYIKFINFLRKSKLTPADVSSVTVESFSSDEWLKPIVEEDLLLQYDVEQIFSLQNSAGKDEVETLKSKLGIAEERSRLAEEFLERTIDDLNKCRKELSRLLLGGNKECSHGKSNDDALMKEEESEGYFSSYAHYGIHEEMLKDKVRTGSYLDFISKNREIFERSKVLDVGCGTSVLSMFAAKAGASQVIGVDYSEIAYKAMDVVRENNMEGLIKIQKCKAEDMLIEGKVDVIVSEWMGYFLLFESMLDTVLYCRDHYLSESGCVYPDKCSIRLVAFADDNLYKAKIKYWDDIYGCKMSAMKTAVLEEPLVEIVDPKMVISQPFILKDFDLMKISAADLEFDECFELRIEKDSILSALVGFFDIDFERNAKHPVRFCTGPSQTSTHWKQTVFFLRDPLPVKADDLVKGRFSCKKNKKDTRSLDIRLIIYDDKENTLCRQNYCMA